MVAVVPVGQRHDPWSSPASLLLYDGTAHTYDVDLHDRAQRLELALWGKRTDRVFLLANAQRTLRQLLNVEVDLARPICLQTLSMLCTEDEQHAARPVSNVDDALAAAERMWRELPERLARLEGNGLRKVARLENLVLRSFAALEKRGLPIDARAWQQRIDEEKSVMAQARADVFAAFADVVDQNLFGEPDISLENEADLQRAFSRLKGAEVSDLSRATLNAIDHPAAAAFLRYRDAAKIVRTYGDAFLERVHPRTDRIHATFIPLGASTGRIASREPNLQNLPSDPRFHACLVAPQGMCLVTADYATCELRILAELSGDPQFIAAFERGEDLHSAVATTMFEQPVSKTENAHLRQAAKAINFGLVYGMGVPALAASLQKTREESETLLHRYFQRFPGVKTYLEHSVDEALRRGYAETLLGRRLHFAPAVLAADNARGELSRIAKNMPIQGTSADMTKLAMVRIHERLVDGFPDAGIVNTIHDELVVECAEAHAQDVAQMVQSEMAEAHRTLLRRVPPSVEVHVGKTWQH